MKYEAWRLTNFNPRSPRGERRSPEEVVCLALRISTRAPREGSDLVKPAGRVDHPHFNPRSPRGERRGEQDNALSQSPALPARGATANISKFSKAELSNIAPNFASNYNKNCFVSLSKAHFPL